jgi:hypothetical protein
MARNPYWQNVTRFYVGFFDKGELAHLVVQFGEMFEHGDYKELTYPRVVSANVLADRIFYQSPGMGRKLAAEIIASPIGWFALSAGDGGSRFTLPKDSAGSEIVRVGKQLLDDDIPPYAAEVVRVMESHGTKFDLVDWWRQKLPPHDSPMWNTWMSVGVGLTQFTGGQGEVAEAGEQVRREGDDLGPGHVDRPVARWPPVQPGCLGLLDVVFDVHMGAVAGVQPGDLPGLGVRGD